MAVNKENPKQESPTKEPETKKEEASSEKELEEKTKQVEELQKQLETLKSTATSTPPANTITFDEVLKMDQLADQINTEVSELALMSMETSGSEEPKYDWQLLDFLLDA